EEHPGNHRRRRFDSRRTAASPLAAQHGTGRGFPGGDPRLERYGVDLTRGGLPGVVDREIRVDAVSRRPALHAAKRASLADVILPHDFALLVGVERPTHGRLLANHDQVSPG